MADRTTISWTDRTWSPWEGCEKVSPACDLCYAEARNKRWHGGENWGPHAPRRLTVDWTKPVIWDRQAAKAGQRISVFPSICDPFDNKVPEAWRVRFFHLIEQTPHLDWLLLTKRIGNVKAMAPGGLPANVMLGATVVTQDEMDRDLAKLVATPASGRFLSVEPMLERIVVDLVPLIGALHWVLCGGESGGKKARPLHPDWVRTLRDSCRLAMIPFHFKQWGEWAPIDQVRGMAVSTPISRDRATFYQWPDATRTWRIGSALAGHHLDGREWLGFPPGLQRVSAS